MKQKSIITTDSTKNIRKEQFLTPVQERYALINKRYCKVMIAEAYIEQQSANALY
jgi:hypothetical protein